MLDEDKLAVQELGELVMSKPGGQRSLQHHSVFSSAYAYLCTLQQSIVNTGLFLWSVHLGYFQV